MDLLILGGTLFLGRHCVDAARERGHRVTLFNRGTRPDVYADVEQLHGDRDGDRSALEGRRWDAVIDTSGYVPRVVGAMARQLATAVDHYVFVSSVSVYADLDVDLVAADAPVALLEDPATEDVPSHYGALKAACERAVEDALPGRATHVRAGLLVGPYDATGRFAYWVRRVAAGGEVLAPGDPGRPVQLIDVRDLATWIVIAIEERKTGTFNVTGPALAMQDILQAMRHASASDARFVWVDEAFLLAQGVVPWSDLPLWLTHADRGLVAVDATRSGVVTRPIAATVSDTAAWLAGIDGAGTQPPARLASGAATRAGLSRERERALLEAWSRAAPAC